MNDLTTNEQRAVRTPLLFLRLRVGAWAPLAKALRYEGDSIQKVPIAGWTIGKAAGAPVAMPSG